MGPWNNWISYKGEHDVSLTPGLEDHLENKMATHSSLLAWEIPWTEEPDRVQTMALQESDMT